MRTIEIGKQSLIFTCGSMVIEQKVKPLIRGMRISQQQNGSGNSKLLRTFHGQDGHHKRDRRTEALLAVEVRAGCLVRVKWLPHSLSDFLEIINDVFLSKRLALPQLLFKNV